MYKFFSRMVLLILVFGVSACSVFQQETDDERVFALVEQRQIALLKQDFEEAYTYMSPGYRELNSIKRFIGDNEGVYSWVSSNVDSVSCEDDVCKAYVSSEFDVTALMAGVGKPSTEKMILPRVNRETWIKLDNKWWFSKSE